MPKYIINVDFIVESEDEIQAVDILQGELKSVPLDFTIGHTDFMEGENDRPCHACGEPTVNKYCENKSCEVYQRDEREQDDDQ